MILTLKGSDDKYIITGDPYPYHGFFSFFIKKSSFAAENIGKTGKSDLKAIFIKSFAIIITASAISFFFATGKWPLVNYAFSQALIICFIWLNNFILQISFPQFLRGIENLIPFDSGIYYFTYIVISFCIFLIKILSLRAQR
jgi:hypothetical protein